MSIRVSLHTLAAAIVATAGAVFPANAADDTFCKDYARAAVNQFRSAEKHERCEGYLRNEQDRWHADWRAHYDWCRGVNRDKAWSERNRRKHELERCARR